MKTYRYFVGIDVSKDELDFALIESNKALLHLEVSNDNKGINQFIKQAKSQHKDFSIDNTLFCLEHTGIYNNPVLGYLHRKHADIWLEQASQIKLSMGISREKNDKVDAQKIGLYAYKNREDVRLWTARAAPTQTGNYCAIRSLNSIKRTFSQDYQTLTNTLIRCTGAG